MVLTSIWREAVELTSVICVLILPQNGFLWPSLNQIKSFLKKFFTYVVNETCANAHDPNSEHKFIGSSDSEYRLIIGWESDGAETI